MHAAGEGRFVVTTRSRLHGLHCLPSMLVATRRVMGELEAGGAAELAASILAGPREFWTVTVWSSRHAMQQFMRSGAHGRHLWDVGDLLESFWLARWRPTRHERGGWNGHTLAPPLRAPHPEPPDPALPEEVRQHVLGEMPHLLAAFGPDGAPAHAHAPEVRAQRAQLAGASAVLLRVPGGIRGRGGRSVLRGLARDLRRHDRDLLRVVTGRGQRRAGRFLLGVWGTEASSGRFVDTAVVRLQERWGADCWACQLLPEHEFGTWDGLRLRDRQAGTTSADAPAGRS